MEGLADIHLKLTVKSVPEDIFCVRVVVIEVLYSSTAIKKSVRMKEGQKNRRYIS